MSAFGENSIQRTLQPATDAERRTVQDSIIAPSAAAFSAYDGEQLKQMATETGTDNHAVSANVADGIVEWTANFGGRELSPEELDILRIGAAMGAYTVLKAHDASSPQPW